MSKEMQHSDTEDRDPQNEISQLTLEVSLGLKRRIIMAANQCDYDTGTKQELQSRFGLGSHV